MDQGFFWEMTYSQWIHVHTSVYGGGEISSPSLRIHVVQLPDGSFFTVDAKRFSTRVCGSGPKAYELTDGGIINVGVKCFRHAEVLFQPSSQLAESTSQRSRATRNATFTSTMYLYDKLSFSSSLFHSLCTTMRIYCLTRGTSVIWCGYLFTRLCISSLFFVALASLVCDGPREVFRIHGLLVDATCRCSEESARVELQSQSLVWLRDRRRLQFVVLGPVSAAQYARNG